MNDYFAMDLKFAQLLTQENFIVISTIKQTEAIRLKFFRYSINIPWFLGIVLPT
jgi:hypothetical protein